MALDQRDYFVDRIRKATGYRERAAFRVPLEGRETDPDASSRFERAAVFFLAGSGTGV